MRNDVRFKWEDREIDPKSNPYQKLEGIGDFVINIEYQTMNIEVETEVLWVDFNDFVSGTGGAMGVVGRCTDTGGCCEVTVAAGGC